MLSPSQPSSHWHKSKHFFVILNNNEDSSLSDFVLLLDECFLALMITKKRSDLVNQLHSLFSTTQQSLEETSHFLYKNMHSHGFSTPEATLLVAGNFCHTLNKRLDDTSNGIGLNSFLPPGGNESGDIRVSVVTARNTYKIENSMFFFCWASLQAHLNCSYLPKPDEPLWSCYSLIDHPCPLGRRSTALPQVDGNRMKAIFIIFMKNCTRCMVFICFV